MNLWVNEKIILILIRIRWERESYGFAHFLFGDSINSKSFRKDEWLQLYSRESRVNKNDQLDWRRSCNSTLQNCTLLIFLCLHLYETILVCVHYIEGSLFVEKKWSLVIFENVKIPSSTPSHLRLNEGNTGIKMARNFLLYDNDILSYEGTSLTLFSEGRFGVWIHIFRLFDFRIRFVWSLKHSSIGTRKFLTSPKNSFEYCFLCP